ncbi:hypothetical protein Pfo_005347, partial [Paulownia fortunei]
MSRTELCRLDEIMVSDIDSQQEFESTSCGEIQVVHDMKTLKGAQKLYAEQREIESSPSRTERSKHHEGYLHLFSSHEIPKKKHYLFGMKDNSIELELDHHTILVGDCISSGPLETSPVQSVINLAEQNLLVLHEKPDYPNSLVLFLQRNNSLTLIHSSNFDSIPDLHFLDLSDTRIRILPSSLFRLSKLKVLMLRNCVCLKELSSEIGKLNHMEVLDLSGTELYNHLQLSFYGPDDESEYARLPSEQMISQSVLSELKALEALSIIVHPEDHRWTNISARILKDVSSLERLIFIQFYFREVEIFQDFIQMSCSWTERVLRKFKFVVGHNVKRIISRVPNEVESLFDQQDQCLRYVNGDKVPQVIKTVLRQVTAFYLDHHIKIQSLSEFGISNFQALKFCVVRECPKIQVILGNKDETECAFQYLEHLGLYYLWEVEHIWESSSPPGRLKRIWKTHVPPSGNFKVLKYLTVNTCPKLQFIFQKSMLECVSNLEELVVVDCESVEKIIKEEKKKVPNNASSLPKLRKLVLRYLPNLVSLGNGLCPSKEIISTHACPNFCW